MQGGVKMRKMMRNFKFVCLVLLYSFLFFCSKGQVIASDGSVTLDIWGPTTSFRTTGPPTIESFNINSAFGGPAILKLTNGSLEDDIAERVSSSIVKLNSQTLFDPSEFNKNVYQLEKDVFLLPGNNFLEVGCVFVNVHNLVGSLSRCVVGVISVERNTNFLAAYSHLIKTPGKTLVHAHEL